MKKIFSTKILLAGIILLFTACKKDDQQVIITSTDSGVFIINEGSFGGSNGELSYWNLSNGSHANNVFVTTNGFPLGDVVQSMGFAGDRAYVAVNNSGKVEVIDKKSFHSLATIVGFSGPRYFISDGNSKGYVSDWISNTIKVLDLGSNSIIKSISVGEGPEQMIYHNGKLFVVNVGGFSSDSTMTVISSATDQVDTTIIVGLNPNSIVIDKNNKIWVLCGGSIGPDWTPGTADDIAGKLLRVNPITMFIEASFNFASSEHPLKLTTNGSKDKLFYLFGNSAYTGSVRNMSITDLTLPTNSIINREAYGLGVHPQSNQIYLGISPAFNQNGTAIRFDANANLIDSITVGIGPNGFSF